MAGRSRGRRSKAEREVQSEAEEILERMRGDLVDLAAVPAGGETDPELVNRLFRASHSLKGLAGLFGCDPVHDLAHHLEDVLDALRLGRVALVEAQPRRRSCGRYGVNGETRTVVVMQRNARITVYDRRRGRVLRRRTVSAPRPECPGTVTLEPGANYVRFRARTEIGDHEITNTILLHVIGP